MSPSAGPKSIGVPARVEEVVTGDVVVVANAVVVVDRATVVVGETADVVVDVGAVVEAPPFPEPQAATSSPSSANR